MGTPPERGPEVFLTDSPFLESGPELDFCLAKLVRGTEPGTTDDIGPDTEKFERVAEFDASVSFTHPSALNSSKDTNAPILSISYNSLNISFNSDNQLT